MKNLYKKISVFVYIFSLTLFFYSNGQADTIQIIKKDSVIQIPIRIDASEVEKAILREISTPASAGIIKKVPFDVKYTVHLEDLKVSFKGTTVQIFSSYLLDFSVDYKNSIKGILNGKVHANLHLVGNISINDDAKLIFKVSKQKLNTEFTKIKIPSVLDKFDFLHISKAELFLAEKFLKKVVNTRILKHIQREISAQQVDIQLRQKIQKLVYANSFAIPISKDLWLLPQAKKVLLSQVGTKNSKETRELFIYIGITAQPKLITSVTKPLSKHSFGIPIEVKSFEPKVYLYPSIYIQYDYVENKITKALNGYISQHYNGLGYSFKNIKLYPSNEKLIISVDLSLEDSAKKALTFYLWGTPTLDKELQTISLKDFEYTLDSKSTLLQSAQWILDDGIKNIIQEKTIFVYKDKLKKLFDKIASLNIKTKNGTLKGTTQKVEVENIMISEDAFIIYATAKGKMSYRVDLRDFKYNSK